MSTRIFEIIKNQFQPPIKILLGRWNIHNQSQTKLKIRYANEDNCGTCSTNILPIKADYKDNNINQPEEFDELYIYI